MLLDQSLYTRAAPGGIPKVNWGHPLARDLRFVALHGRVSAFAIESVTPNASALNYVTNPLSWSNTSRCYSPKYGTGVNSGASSSGFDVVYPGISANIRSTTLLIGKLGTGTSASYLVGTTNSFRNGYSIVESVGGVAGNIRLEYPGIGTFSPTTVSVDTTNIHCFAAVNAGAGASNTTKLFVDGVLKDTWASGASPFFDGSNFFDPTPNGSRHSYVSMIFARELSVAELLSLQENPYQIFRTHQRTFVSSPAVTYSTRITWAEAQYQASTASTDYSSPMSRGIFRGIERGVA